MMNNKENTEPETTALADFRAGHPKVREVQDSHAAEFKDKFVRLTHGGIPLPTLLHEFIAKAEQSRQIGIVLLEFSGTLPGRKLTRDFYEQARDLFTDGQNQAVAFDLLEWFMRVARTNLEPITSFKQAGCAQQLFLLASGEDTFALEAEATRPPPTLHPPPNPLSQLRELFRGSEIKATVERLRSVSGYWKDGHLRPDLCAMLRVEMKPELQDFDEAREFVRRELGF